MAGSKPARRLIAGASGGVGSFAVQIAKAFGAEVTGVCSAARVDAVRAIGADHIVDYTIDDFAAGGHRYDVILDPGGSRRLSHLRSGVRSPPGKARDRRWRDRGPVARRLRSSDQDRTCHRPDLYAPRGPGGDTLHAGRPGSRRGRHQRFGVESVAVAASTMTTASVAGLLMIVVALAFNAAFALLAARFDYPEILREPTADVLAKFRSGGTPLVLLWWGFALTAVLMVPLVILLSSAISDADPTLIAVATTVGVIAAGVQFLGLIRWPFLVPYLARTAAEPDASPARREAVEIVFESFNRYLGVAVGEHLGYLLTGAWTTLTGIALTQTTAAPSWVGVLGIFIGPVLTLCSLEFVGRHEPVGWTLAERLTPITYIAWSLWLIATGIALLA
jgi:hypothetical protein